MKVIFRTNLDWYKTVSWPVLDFPPRIGEDVFVHPGSERFCDVNNIPSKLRVVNVSYHVDKVEIELWYNSDNLKLMSQKQLNHLYRQ